GFLPRHYPNSGVALTQSPPSGSFPAVPGMPSNLMSDLDDTAAAASPDEGKPLENMTEGEDAASHHSDSEAGREEASTFARSEEAGALGSVPSSDQPETGLPKGDIPPQEP